MEERKPRIPSTKDRLNELMKRVDGWLKQGDTIEEALERLTPKQYDFLIDHDIDFDNLILTTEQIEAVKSVKKGERHCKPGGYNKVYPQSKQDLYTGIVQYIQEQGATIIPKDKENFRDLDFTIDGKRYRIVLSMPRK